VQASTFFDIGSITKVVLTTSIIARLVQKRKINVDQTVGDFLPGLAAYKSLSIADLLSHSAGLVGWLPFFRESQDPAEWLVRSSDRVIVLPPNRHTIYSDFGFILLGLMIRSFGSLSTLGTREVFGPLRMTETRFGPVPAGRVAATEFCLWRQRLLQGEVFDENCFALGGRSGHAGLFSTARGLARWCREWLLAGEGKSRWISPETANLFTRRSHRVKGSTWALGFDTKSKAFSSAGRYFSQRSFGHLGYPGTSVWIDPERRAFAIFLTNRIHPSRWDERIKRLRPLLHDEVVRYWRSF